MWHESLVKCFLSLEKMFSDVLFQFEGDPARQIVVRYTATSKFAWGCCISCLGGLRVGHTALRRSKGLAFANVHILPIVKGYM